MLLVLTQARFQSKCLTSAQPRDQLTELEGFKFGLWFLDLSFRFLQLGKIQTPANIVIALQTLQI